MTWLKSALAALAFSLGITVAGAFEIVDTNNGFAGPAFTLGDPDEDAGGPNLNTDDFGEAHIYMRADHEKEFDGYSYSGFVFEDQILQHTVKVDTSSTLNVSDTSKSDPKH